MCEWSNTLKNDTPSTTDPVKDVRNNVEEVTKEASMKEDATVEFKTCIMIEAEISVTMLYIVSKS